MVYRDVFDAWTREGRIYDGLSTKLISKATFKSAVFRQAYAAEYSGVRQMVSVLAEDSSKQ